MMSMQHEQEHKQADRIRGDKDDFKRQSAEMRKSGRGIAGVDTLDDAAFTHPHLSADPQPGRSVPLEPTVQAPRKIEHTSMADMPFSSIPDSDSSNIKSSSGPAMMKEVGHETAQSIEAVKQKLEPLMEPVVAKATSIYEMWQKEGHKEGDASSGPSMQERAAVAGADLKERATVAASQAQTVYNEKIAPAVSDAAAKAGPMLSNAAEKAKPMLAQASAQAQVAAAQARPVIENAIEQAKPIIANAAAQAQKIYAEQVQPALASGMSAAQEQIGVMREDGLSKTMEKAGTAYRRNVAAAKTTINETYEAKVPLEHRQRIASAQKGAAAKLRLGWNKALDVWEAQQPMLREYQAKATTFIRERKLQAPLAIAGTVLLLLLGWSILHSLSASRASHEQVVVYQPSWRPSTGPVQGAEMPGMMDKVNAKISGMDAKIIDGVDSIKDSASENLERIKARSADLKQHAEDSISMGIDSLKVRASELADSLPSTAEIKARADSTLNSARAAMPSTNDIKARMPDTDGLRARAESTLNAAKAAIPSTAEIKARAESTLADAKAAMPGTAQPVASKEGIVGSIKEGAADLQSRMQHSELRLKINDRIEHVKALLPHQLTALRTRLGDLYDRLTPAQRHFAHAHPEVLNPEDHVIEYVDEHGNKKSTLDI